MKKIADSPSPAPLEQLLRHFALPTHVTGIVYHSTAWADPPSRRERVARAIERVARWVRGKA